MQRRDFIKYGAITAYSGILQIQIFHHQISKLTNFDSPNKENLNFVALFDGFQKPPNTSKLFVRWWWNGNRLDATEILRELDVLKEAGIGGVEINPIAFPRNNEPGGYESMTIFSDEWLKMLEVALKGAKAKGLTCDMIVGSGWPFGGEFLEKDDQTQMVTIETIDLEGEQTYTFNIEALLEKVDPELHSKNDKVYRDLMMIKLFPKISDKLIDGKDLENAIHSGQLTITTPPGNHVLYYVVKLTGYMAVINGSPGAAGPVLNHYSKEATSRYLERISGIIAGKIGNMGDYIRAMFCDSMELEGANWVDDLPSEFKKRRGYDLLPYLPLVLKKVGHMGNPLEAEYGTQFPDEIRDDLNKIALDYYITRIELFKERFIDTFNDWCHKNGVQSRMQAYGRGMHPLEASMEVDIPECETWLFKDVGREYPNTGLGGRAPRMSNKYVASGAVLANKKIVSCEEITNTAMAFMATLENIKIAGDQSNICGVNHSILHGFNYSPPEIPFPGWVRYGAYFNERNTWWPYFKLWSDYKARLSYIFQEATPMANVAILQPLTDLWIKYGPQRDPFPRNWYPEYQNNLWEAIHQNGGGCDYVSENIINRSTFSDGRMIYNKRSYSVLILPEIETLDLHTTESLLNFAQAGGTIIFIKNTPLRSPSFLKKDEDTTIRSLIEQIIQYKNVYLTDPPQDNIMLWYRNLMLKTGITPYVQFQKTHKYINQITLEQDHRKIFFIANHSLWQEVHLDVKFDVPDHLVPWVWDPETGERYKHPYRESPKELVVSLPQATSMLIVYDEHDIGDYLDKTTLEYVSNNYRKLHGMWEVTLEHFDGTQSKINFENLQDLTQLEATKHFAGKAIYELVIEVNDKRTNIDLGNVQGISTLILNDELIGTKWYGKHLYKIGDLVKLGKNRIRVEVTTILGNYMKGLTDNKVAQDWVGRQEYYPMGMMGPVVYF